MGRGLREEEHPDAVLPLSGQRNAEPLGLAPEKLVGKLENETGAVARIRIAAASTTMREVDENLNALFYDFVRAASLDIGDETDPTGVMFAPGVVKTLSLG